MILLTVGLGVLDVYKVILYNKRMAHALVSTTDFNNLVNIVVLFLNVFLNVLFTDG